MPNTVTQPELFHENVDWALLRENLSSGFRPGHTQISLHSFKGKLESWEFAGSMFSYHTLQRENYKEADQTAWRRRAS